MGEYLIFKKYPFPMDSVIGGAMYNNQKVMVVDDNAELRSMLRYGLDSYGFEVTFCENGVEAFEKVKHDAFDYIITDYQMPQMNGIELTKKVREHSSRIVIIGMSGEDLGMDFLNAGANDFLRKPFVPYRLAMMIDGGDILT
jgi:CheY-like chemotaxis protein